VRAPTNGNLCRVGLCRLKKFTASLFSSVKGSSPEHFLALGFLRRSRPPPPLPSRRRRRCHCPPPGVASAAASHHPTLSPPPLPTTWRRCCGAAASHRPAPPPPVMQPPLAAPSRTDVAVRGRSYPFPYAFLHCPISTARICCRSHGQPHNATSIVCTDSALPHAPQR
jgi:hypothetical protein